MSRLAAIFERVIAPSQGGMSEKLSQEVLSMEIAPEDQVRYEELGKRAELEPLTPEDKSELDGHVFGMAF